MNKAFIKRHDISYEKRLETAFYKNNGKSYQEIATIVGFKECSFRSMQKVL